MAALVPAAALCAQERQDAGLVVPVPTAISTESTNRLRTAVYGPLKRFEAERGRDARHAGVLRLVCDFNPDGRPNGSDDFGACHTLAKYLRQLQQEGVQTVAYVHGDVTRHAVLAVLACQEIVMSSDPPARLGQVVPPGRVLDEDERVSYENLTRHRYPLALVRKMYDRNDAVFKAPPGFKGERYLDSAGKVPPGAEQVPELGPGEVALYSFAQAREFGLCQPAPRNSMDEVVEAYRLGRSSLAQPLDRVVAWRVVVRGTLNGELREKVQRRVRRAVGARANLIIIELDCGDGDSEVAHELGLYLSSLNDDRRESPVQTIAFVTREARNTAAFLALACNKIVMQREQRQGDKAAQPGARLGEFDAYIRENPTLEPALRRNLAEIARKQHYSAVLAEGLVGPGLRIHLVESVKGGSGRRFLSEEDLRADQAGERRWRSVELVWPRTDKDRGHPLTVTAERAGDLGLADDTVANFEELCEKEGVPPGDVRTAESDWLDDLADFLRDPWTSVVLVMLGITCLILELKMPGVVMPGVIAAICFVLFFWSHSQLGGQITWLAVLLFLLGLVLIGLEVFVLPGFGVAGISGILLVIGSLGLVAYGHWPRGPEEWSAFGQHVGPFGISILGALVAAFVLARYLPTIPYVNRLILRPQEEVEEGPEALAESIRPEVAGLLGAIGVTVTPLRPAGKAQFGDAFLDVVAEGSYVVPGTRVQVIEIEGNRVVVKEV
jgi:membrane-bound ClpP family serine protease